MSSDPSVVLSQPHRAWLQEHLTDFRNADEPKAKDGVLKAVTSLFCKKFHIPEKDTKLWPQVIKDFMYLYGRQREHRDLKRWTKEVKYRDVIADYKAKEISAAMAKGKIGTYQGAMKFVVDNLSAEEEKMLQAIFKSWTDNGVPLKKQQEIAARYGARYIREFTDHMLATCGISCVVIASSVTADGQRATLLHDYLPEYGGRGLVDAVPNYKDVKMSAAMNSWELSFDEPAPPKVVKGQPRILVEMNDKKQLMYPEYDPKWHSDTKKTLVRDIVNATYGGPVHELARVTED
ncbi:hypothetical protein DENSPDRAFT_886607 [Dentipellis sp. KUC8613]|nr:hypothetical protein DENSPDRAFT_886607 [Dentipellis sp. KUC8613]